MKKILILMLAAILAACSSAPAAVTTEPPAPTEVLPTQTPVVVVQTVVVEATPLPTEVPPTPVPPTPETVVVTVVVQPTNPPADTSANVSAGGNVDPNAPIAIDATLGRGVFTAMTMSGNALTLRCAPRDITFNVTTPNIDIADVAFYYRIVDLKRLYPSEWKNFGKMTAMGGGNFTLTFSGENVDPNLRLDGSFLDFQFVGLAKSGNVVDRSERITELVKYTFDCP